MGTLAAPSLSYYANLFTSQYRTNSPKSIQAWFSACMQPIADINACAATLNAAYQLGTAIGVQLDKLGQILGQSRIMPFQPSDSVSPILDDTTYTKLLLAKVGINTWKGKIPLLYPLWQLIFPVDKLFYRSEKDLVRKE